MGCFVKNRSVEVEKSIVSWAQAPDLILKTRLNSELGRSAKRLSFAKSGNQGKIAPTDFRPLSMGR